MCESEWLNGAKSWQIKGPVLLLQATYDTAYYYYYKLNFFLVLVKRFRERESCHVPLLYERFSFCQKATDWYFSWKIKKEQVYKWLELFGIYRESVEVGWMTTRAASELLVRDHYLVEFTFSELFLQKKGNCF